MEHRIAHDLSLPLARVVTRKALESYQERYPEYKPTGTWVTADQATFTLHILGANVGGDVVVDTTAVTLRLDVPLLLRPWQNRVATIVEEEITLWLQWGREGRFNHLV